MLEGPYPHSSSHLLLIIGCDAKGRIPGSDRQALWPRRKVLAYNRADAVKVRLAFGGVGYVLERAHAGDQGRRSLRTPVNT
jgi:hypothetical protein